MLEIKIGRRFYTITEEDRVLFNGASFQLITQSYIQHFSKGWEKRHPTISKLKCNQWIKQGLLVHCGFRMSQGVRMELYKFAELDSNKEVTIFQWSLRLIDEELRFDFGEVIAKENPESYVTLDGRPSFLNFSSSLDKESIDAVVEVTGFDDFFVFSSFDKTAEAMAVKELRLSMRASIENKMAALRSSIAELQDHVGELDSQLRLSSPATFDFSYLRR